MTFYTAPKRPSRWRHTFSVTALVTLLSACGGSSDSPPVDPLASFKQQRLDWQPCDPTILGGTVPFFEELGDRARCALMRAPLDYAKPSQGELSVALLRVSAEQPQQRAGFILFNQGGPGADSLGFAPQYGVLWADGNPNNPNGKVLKDLSNRYDLIGFSPRGLGASSRLYCASNEAYQPPQNFSVNRSESDLNAVLENARLEAKTCLKNPLTRAISTEATARDIDLMRVLIGDDRVNYIGYSYGSWLGTWYARLFPERVGRMLLDSSMNVEGSFSDAKQMSEFGFHRIFNDIVAPYAARHPDWYGLGNTADAVRSSFQNLRSDIKGWVLGRMTLTQSPAIADAVITLRAATGLQELIDSSPQANPQELIAASQAITFMSNPDNDAKTHLLIAELLASSGPTQRKSILLEPDKAVYLSVICNDLPTYGDESYWVSQGNQDAARYPGWGGTVTNNPCLHWGGTSIQRPSIVAATQAAPILMLQSRYDGATPLEAARVTLEALPNARMIVIENEYSHGLFPYGDSCADPQVAEYLLTGKLPPRTSSCVGKPLLGETVPFTVEPKKAAAVSKSAQTIGLRSGPDPADNTYKNPERAAEIMRSIHQKLQQSQRSR